MPQEPLSARVGEIQPRQVVGDKDEVQRVHGTADGLGGGAPGFKQDLNRVETQKGQRDGCQWPLCVVPEAGESRLRMHKPLTIAVGRAIVARSEHHSFSSGSAFGDAVDTHADTLSRHRREEGHDSTIGRTASAGDRRITGHRC